MKIHKYNIIIILLICILSIIIAFSLNKYNVEFWANVFIGISSSGVLALFLSIIGYQIERKKALEEFYTCAIKTIANINKFEKNNDLQYTMDLVLKMNNFDYTDLDMSYGNIDFIFANNTHRKYIYEKIYKRIVDLKNIIAEKSFHFREYKKANNGNLEVVEYFINEIDKQIMERQEEHVGLNGSVCEVKYYFNKFAKEIESELNEKYYKIMYGRKASEI